MMTSRNKAIAMIVGSVGILILILVLKQLNKPAPICDPNIKSKTVILLDHSESISVQTGDAIVERTLKFIETNVPAGEFISVYEISKLSKSNLIPSFEGCKPRQEGSQLVENANKVVRDFANFKLKLKKDLSEPIKNSGEPAESPIAQAITDLSLDDKHFRSSKLTRLIVFSDFMEYTPKFSLYTCSSGKQAIKDFRASRGGAVERPTFRNTQVFLNVIPRSIQNRSVLQCRDEFWAWFFGDNQGSCSSDACLTRDYLPG